MARASLIGFLLLTFLTGLGLSQEQKKEDEKAREESRRQSIQWKKNFLRMMSSTRPKRASGLILGTTVELKVVKTGSLIHIKWALDYTGPRQPLIILKPTLQETSGQTVVAIYAEGKDKLLYNYDLESSKPDFSNSPWAPFPGPDLFLIVHKGNQGSGVITVPVKRLQEFFRKTYPKQFPEPPSEVYLQLRHNPFDRGGDLDAWTGEVWGNFHTLKLADS